jgi:multiple sugar transport system substrate-binding protein
MEGVVISSCRSIVITEIAESATEKGEKRRRMSKLKRALTGILSLLVVIALATVGTQAAKTRLVIQTHWSDFQLEGVVDANGKLVSKGLRQYVEEYMKLNPGVEIELQSVPMEEYLQKILVSRSAGVSPDIYIIRSLWGVQLAESGIIESPPPALVDDIKKNYIPAAIEGATINGKIMGIPVEVGNYCLVYNKLHLAEKGYKAPPKTWSEMVDMASKLTVRDKTGAITRYGFSFLAGWDSAVVHPFLGLLWDMGGEYLSPDYKKCLLNSPEGVKALEAELDIFRTGGTDISGSVWNFPQQKVSMIIMASWYENSLKKGLGADYEKVVGVAPIPKVNKNVNAMYTFFATVDSGSKHRKEAWDFLRWFTAEETANKTTRLGDLMVQNIGSVPARKADLDNHPAELQDHYTKMFIDELKNAKHEPNMAQAAEINTILMQEIVEAWHGNKTSKKALDDATKKINAILAEYY